MATIKDSKDIKNYINGTFYDSQSKQVLNNYNPAIGAINGSIPDSNADDVQQAVRAAELAFPSWSKTSVEKRSAVLKRIADIIDQNIEVLAAAESEDNGKPIALATELDIPRAAANFRFYADAITQFSSESHQGVDSINYTLRSPLGVVGCISPWNLPLYLFTWKIAPALAAGNCVVGKPSEISPKTAYLLSKICDEAGLPNGVLNIVHGLGNKVGRAIVEHPLIKAVSFTGGTDTGREIAQMAAPSFKKLSLELGGKNPILIFDDCDFDDMVETTVKSSFSNQGQICLCGSRILVQAGIYEKFKSEFLARVYKLKIGDPSKPNTDIGALVSEQHMEKVLYHIDLAKEEGGTILLGGSQVKVNGRCESGWFVEPTVIEGLANDSRTNQEEIFGPVVTIAPFETEAQALEMANSSEYGLASAVWTTNINRAMRVANNIESGIVWINCWMNRDLRTPFGGVKNSGLGREGGLNALQFFTEQKNVCIKLRST